MTVGWTVNVVGPSWMFCAASRVSGAFGNASNSESLLNLCHAASMSAGLQQCSDITQSVSFAGCLLAR